MKFYIYLHVNLNFNFIIFNIICDLQSSRYTFWIQYLEVLLDIIQQGWATQSC